MYSTGFVVLMGLGTVFFCLICIIFLTMAMGKLLRPKENAAGAANTAPAATVDPAEPELAAVIAAALADNMGTDASAITITSIKKR